MAFAVRWWEAEVAPARREPVFAGEHRRFLPALLTICSGLGIDMNGLEDLLD